MSDAPISRNSFDLIRLIAATQVAICHSIEFMSPQYTHAVWFRLLESIPGVPIFFFISGFLISRSFEQNSDVRDYALNRGLRIFPALHVCVLLNILAVAATGYFASVQVGFVDVLLLYLAKVSIFQFYNPDFMRGFGDGVLNGSLWTICVELQFYILIPFLYGVIQRLPKEWVNVFLVLTVAVFIGLNRLVYISFAEYSDTVVWKLIRVSFVPWFYMFLTGVLFQRNFEYLNKALSRVNPVLLLVLVLGYVFWMRMSGFSVDNRIGPLLYFPLIVLVFRLSFSPLSTVSRLLRKNDVSYGMYIYHMPIANTLIYYGWTGELLFPLFVVVCSMLVAVCSWFGIEKVFLGMKRRPLNPIAFSGA